MDKVELGIIIDSREQNPWDFCESLPSGVVIRNQCVDNLQCGDYSISGYDMPKDDYSVIIERKSSLVELLGNIGSHWDRFTRELEIMSQYSTKLIVVEDDMRDALTRYQSDYGYNKYFNLNPDFILSRLSNIKVTYGIDTVFLSNRTFAIRYVANVFKHTVLRDWAND